MGKIRRNYLVMFVVLLVFSSLIFFSNLDNFKFNGTDEESRSNSGNRDGVVEEKLAETENKSEIIDFQKYNYMLVDENLKEILKSNLGENGRAYFYLPSANYINVTKGNSFGVAFALQNQGASENDYFEYEFKSDSLVVENCGISRRTSESWIESGQKSFGKISEGVVDYMTVYFVFPKDAPTCNLKYNFEIKKNGLVYSTKQLEFNIN